MSYRSSKTNKIIAQMPIISKGSKEVKKKIVACQITKTLHLESMTAVNLNIEVIPFKKKYACP
jgi:hypothetical protein